MDTLCFCTLFRPKDQENWTECERIVSLAGEAEFFSIINTPGQCIFLDLKPSKRLWKLKAYERIVRPTREASFWTLSTLLETLCGFGLDAIQKTKKTEKNEKELSVSLGNQNTLASSTLLQTLDAFRLDVNQKKNKKIDKNVKELSDSPGKKLIQNLTMTEWRLEGPNPP